jgi:hypothetical protein
LRPSVSPLIDAFGRFGSLNSIAAGVQGHGRISLADSDILTCDHMAAMVGKIDAAIDMLSDLERI